MSERIFEDLLDFSSKVLVSRKALLWIALRQRSKFEHWLKFELAGALEDHSTYSNVAVEETCEGGRADIAFTYESSRCFLWLKTPNSNWTFPGVNVMSRPITKNYEGMLNDIRSMKMEGNYGLLLAALFPVDSNWSQEELQNLISASGKGRELLTHNHRIRMVDIRDTIGIALLLFH